MWRAVVRRSSTSKTRKVIDIVSIAFGISTFVGVSYMVYIKNKKKPEGSEEINILEALHATHKPIDTKHYPHMDKDLEQKEREFEEIWGDRSAQKPDAKESSEPTSTPFSIFYDKVKEFVETLKNVGVSSEKLKELVKYVKEVGASFVGYGPKPGEELRKQSLEIAKEERQDRSGQDGEERQGGDLSGKEVSQESISTPDSIQKVTIEEKTQEPVEVKTQEPVEVKTQEPVEVKTQEPVEVKTQEPVEVKTQEPVEVKTQEPVEVKTQEPVEVKTQEPVEVKTQEPVEIKQEEVKPEAETETENKIEDIPTEPIIQPEITPKPEVKEEAPVSQVPYKVESVEVFVEKSTLPPHELPAVVGTILPKTQPKPDTPSSEPQIPISEPETSPSEPQIPISEPETSPSEPQIPISEPESSPSEPKTSLSESEIPQIPRVELESPTEPVPSPPSKPTDLQSALEGIKKELKEQQDLQEQKLISTMEDTVSHLIDQVIPKVSSHLSSIPIPSTAAALSQSMDFAKSSTEEIKKQFTDLISAYEARFESVGTKHFDEFLKRLKKQKKRFKHKLDKVRKEHLNQLEKTLIERDNEWREVLESEFKRAESHFGKQSEFDGMFITQEVTLDLSRQHQAEIQRITELLSEATERRFEEMENMLLRIKKVEDIQDRQYNTILSLFSVHKLHVTIENLQRTLNFDDGNLKQQLEALSQIAQQDVIVASALAIVEDHLSSLLQRGVASLGQIQNSYSSVLTRARKAALLKDDNLTSWMLANFASLIVPASARNVDESDPFTYLHFAGENLERGDLKGALGYLEKLEGFPREEVQGLIDDISARLALSHMLEVLSTHSISLVNELVNIQY
jgi:hypothetical protein